MGLLPSSEALQPAQIPSWDFEPLPLRGSAALLRSGTSSHEMGLVPLGYGHIRRQSWWAWTVQEQDVGISARVVFEPDLWFQMCPFSISLCVPYGLVCVCHIPQWKRVEGCSFFFLVDLPP